MVTTEFGRTAAVNGAAGTDHGTGYAMMLLGGRVRGARVLGRWPGLSRGQLYENRDLAATTDFRDVFQEVARAQFGISASLFPGYTPGRGGRRRLGFTLQRKDLLVTRQPRPAPLVSALLSLALAAGTAAAGEGHGTDLFAGLLVRADRGRRPPRRQPGRGLRPLRPALRLRGHERPLGQPGGREPQRPHADGRARRALRQARRDGVLRARAGGPGAGQGARSACSTWTSRRASKSFGILAGGGVDFRVSTTLAVRLQGDYLASDSGAEGCPPVAHGA